MNKSLGHLHLVVKEFLNRRWDKKSPLLIGYSGGGDSTALLHCAIHWKKAPIHIAHVDHGWRQESQKEAHLLEKQAKELSLPFHTIRLTHCSSEEDAREKRLSFFSDLQKEICFQAVLLGHHANDHAETALKRLFEGASLTRLFGMKEESRFQELLLWRPFLKVKKERIEDYLAAKGLSYFNDSSNCDSKYLRARMRCSLFPYLEEIFGKKIVSNLQLLAARSEELGDYLFNRVEPLFKNAMKTEGGFRLDCNGADRVEIRYLLLELFQKEGLNISRKQLETLLEWIDRGGVRRELKVRQGIFAVEKKVLCFNYTDS